MGLCFVEPAAGRGASAFRYFLGSFLLKKPGDIVLGPDALPPNGVIWEHQEGRPKHDITYSSPLAESSSVKPGMVIGTHDGLWTGTVGERAHVQLPQGNPRFQGRWYISRKDIHHNRMEIVRGWSNGRMWSQEMIVAGWHWLGSDCQSLVKDITSKLKISSKGDSDKLRPIADPA